MIENQLRDLIERTFGRTLIYSDDFKKTVCLNYILNQSKVILENANISIDPYEYLNNAGLIINIERDMRYSKPEPRESFQDFSLYVENLFECLPILGMAVFDEEDRKLLSQKANEAFQKLRNDVRLNNEEQNYLVINTIEQLKKWNPHEEDDNSLWSYIYKQYGYLERDDSAKNRIIYKGFRDAIKSVMMRYERFFAPAGTQRYYSTLMLHTLAPKKSVFNLFDILVRFFEKNLKFQYIANDPSYHVFVERIKTRWGIPSELERLGLYSAAMYSGLKTLFLNRSDFMAFFCDKLVYKMNQLLQAGCLTEGLLENNYLDDLLREWYLEKTQNERTVWSRTQRENEGERAVASARDTNPQYVLHAEKVALFFPNIRLAVADEHRPIVNLFQDSRLILSSQLETFGDELTRTIRKKYLYLDETFMDFQRKAITLRMEIVHNQKVIYNSQEHLNRRFILFNDFGIETKTSNKKTSSMSFLFALDNAELISVGLEDAFQFNHPGQLLRVDSRSIQDLRVDGNEVFLSPSEKSSVRVYCSSSEFHGAAALKGINEYVIHDQRFSFKVYLPEGDSALSYVVSINDKKEPLSSFSSIDDDGEIYLIENIPAGNICEIVIKDFITSKEVFSYNFIILDGFRIDYKEPLYLSNQDIQGRYAFQDREETREETFKVQLSGENSARVVVSNREWVLIIFPPLLQCRMLGKELFINNPVFWYREIDKDIYLTPLLPNGWQADIHLDNHLIAQVTEGDTVDFGNYISAYQSLNQSHFETLYFSLYRPNQREKRIPIPACKIYFQPTFHHSPLRVENGKLLWEITNNYVGDVKSEFQVRVMEQNEEFANYTLTNKDEIVERRFPFEFGILPYRIYLRKRSLFDNKEELIYEDELKLGNENELRFYGKNISLIGCNYWDPNNDQENEMDIREKSARISEIRYVGLSAPSGETNEFPEYRGTLSFFNPQRNEWQAFNFNENSRKYLLVNPVRIWFVNDERIIVRDCDGEALHFDKSRKQFMGNIDLSRRLLDAICIFPDFYLYRSEEK